MADAPRLVRERAGRYRSGDERFSVQEEDGAWFVEDHAQLSGFGQPLILGPFASLKLARTAVEEAATKQLALKPRASGGRAKPAPPPQPEPEPQPEPTWLDRLGDDEASRARSMIRALERLGIHDAESLVREDFEGAVPAVARALVLHEIRRRVGSDVDDEALASVLEVMTDLGLHQPRGLPGWELVERHGPDPDDPRRIVMTR